jgi:hypothetical protein
MVRWQSTKESLPRSNFLREARDAFLELRTKLTYETSLIIAFDHTMQLIFCRRVRSSTWTVHEADDVIEQLCDSHRATSERLNTVGTSRLYISTVAE